MFADENGIVTVKIDQQEVGTTSVAINETNIVGSITRIEPKTSELPNVINVKFIDDKGFEVFEVVEFNEATLNAEGRKEAELNLRLVQNESHAIEMAKRILYSSRAPTFQFKMNTVGYDLDVYGISSISDVFVKRNTDGTIMPASGSNIVAEGSKLRIFNLGKDRIIEESGKAPITVLARLYNDDVYAVNPKDNEGIRSITPTIKISDAPGITNIPAPSNVTVLTSGDFTAVIDWSFISQYQTEISFRPFNAAIGTGNTVNPNTDLNPNGLKDKDLGWTIAKIVDANPAYITLPTQGQFEVSVRFISSRGNLVGPRTITPKFSSTGIQSTIQSNNGVVTNVDDDSNPDHVTRQFVQIRYGDSDEGLGIRSSAVAKPEIQTSTHSALTTEPNQVVVDSDQIDAKTTITVPNNTFKASTPEEQSFNITGKGGAVAGNEQLYLGLPNHDTNPLTKAASDISQDSDNYLVGDSGTKTAKIFANVGNTEEADLSETIPYTGTDIGLTNITSRKVVWDDLLYISRKGGIYIYDYDTTNEIWNSTPKQIIKIEDAYPFPGLVNNLGTKMATPYVQGNYLMTQISADLFQRQDLFPNAVTTFPLGDGIGSQDANANRGVHIIYKRANATSDWEVFQRGYQGKRSIPVSDTTTTFSDTNLDRNTGQSMKGIIDRRDGTTALENDFYIYAENGSGSSFAEGIYQSKWNETLGYFEAGVNVDAGENPSSTTYFLKNNKWIIHSRGGSYPGAPVTARRWISAGSFSGFSAISGTNGRYHGGGPEWIFSSQAPKAFHINTRNATIFNSYVCVENSAGDGWDIKLNIDSGGDTGSTNSQIYLTPRFLYVGRDHRNYPAGNPGSQRPRRYLYNTTSDYNYSNSTSNLIANFNDLRLDNNSSPLVDPLYDKPLIYGTDTATNTVNFYVDSSKPNDYNISQLYRLGNETLFNGQIFLALADSTGSEPVASSDTSNWEYLRDFTNTPQANNLNKLVIVGDLTTPKDYGHTLTENILDQFILFGFDSTSAVGFGKAVKIIGDEAIVQDNNNTYYFTKESGSFSFKQLTSLNNAFKFDGTNIIFASAGQFEIYSKSGDTFDFSTPITIADSNFADTNEKNWALDNDILVYKSGSTVTIKRNLTGTITTETIAQNINGLSFKGNQLLLTDGTNVYEYTQSGGAFSLTNTITQVSNGNIDINTTTEFAVYDGTNITSTYTFSSGAWSKDREIPLEITKIRYSGFSFLGLNNALLTIVDTNAQFSPTSLVFDSGVGSSWSIDFDGVTINTEGFTSNSNSTSALNAIKTAFETAATAAGKSILIVGPTFTNDFNKSGNSTGLIPGQFLTFIAEDTDNIVSSFTINTGTGATANFYEDEIDGNTSVVATQLTITDPSTQQVVVINASRQTSSQNELSTIADSIVSQINLSNDLPINFNATSTKVSNENYLITFKATVQGDTPSDFTVVLNDSGEVTADLAVSTVTRLAAFNAETMEMTGDSGRYTLRIINNIPRTALVDTGTATRDETVTKIKSIISSHNSAINVDGFTTTHTNLNGIYNVLIPGTTIPTFTGNFDPDGTDNATLVSNSLIYKHTINDLYIWNRFDSTSTQGGWHISGTDTNVSWAFLSISNPQTANIINSADWVPTTGAAGTGSLTKDTNINTTNNFVTYGATTIDGSDNAIFDVDWNTQDNLTTDFTFDQGSGTGENISFTNTEGSVGTITSGIDLDGDIIQTLVSFSNGTEQFLTNKPYFTFSQVIKGHTNTTMNDIINDMLASMPSAVYTATNATTLFRVETVENLAIDGTLTWDINNQIGGNGTATTDGFIVVQEGGDLPLYYGIRSTNNRTDEFPTEPDKYTWFEIDNSNGATVLLPIYRVLSALYIVFDFDEALISDRPEFRLIPSDNIIDAEEPTASFNSKFTS